jgi:hypothetical protein
MQKLWYNTNDASGHEKNPSKHEIFVNNKNTKSRVNIKVLELGPLAPLIKGTHFQ